VYRPTPEPGVDLGERTDDDRTGTTAPPRIGAVVASTFEELAPALPNELASLHRRRGDGHGLRNPGDAPAPGRPAHLGRPGSGADRQGDGPGRNRNGSQRNYGPHDLVALWDENPA
jgi:hypothetical protein